MKFRIIKLAVTIIIIVAIVLFFYHYRDGEIRLIVTGDDMGFSHAANMGCIKSYKEGILTTVEVMVPCESFKEAVELLRENPGIDVGIHLTLNSEWENIKWGPLTDVPSLVDKNGHFFQMTWPDAAHPPEKALGTSNWKIEEIEKELRAQIETAIRLLPRCSHATPHMGFHSISSSMYNLVFSLIREYNIDANIRYLPIRNAPLFTDAFTAEEMISSAVKVLENLGPGTWEFADHPGMIIEGVENHWHIGAENDAYYRDAVTKAFTSEKVMEVIKRRNIKLIGYKDLKFWH